MNNTVRIKNTSGGMTVYLNSEVPFEELLADIEKKFGDSAKFFGSVQTVLSLEGRELTVEEEARIVEAICRTTQLEIVCLLEKEKEVVNEPEPEEAPAEEPVVPKEERVVFYKRCISEGEIIKADKDIIIFGNVSAGATIISTDSIYVYGGLYGEAYAGIDNGNDFVISAMDFMPEKIGIGKFEYQGKKVSKWKRKSNFEPQIAYVRKNKIVIEQITKELLNSLA